MKTVLLDCDGVLADFLSPCLDIINRYMVTLIQQISDPTQVAPWEHDDRHLMGWVPDPRRWSEPKTLDDLTHWNLFEALGVPKEVKREVYREMKQPGWCESALRPFDGAVEAVRRLREVARVVVVTTPMDGPTWTHERENWLHRHFDLKRADVIHAHQKELVRGDVLVDDKPDHVRAWSAAWPDGHGVLWKYITNTWVTDVDWRGLHTGQWDSVMELAR